MRPWANDDDPTPEAPTPLTSRAAIEPSAVPWGTYSRTELDMATDTSLSRPSTAPTSTTTRVLTPTVAAPIISSEAAPAVLSTAPVVDGGVTTGWTADAEATKRDCVAQMLGAGATEAEIMAALASIDAQYAQFAVERAAPAAAPVTAEAPVEADEDFFFASREAAMATARRARGCGVAGVFAD